MCNLLLMMICINLLSPKSDQHQFSPNNINTQSREKVLRIHKMIRKLKGKCFDLLSNSLNLFFKEIYGG